MHNSSLMGLSPGKVTEDAVRSAMVRSRWHNAKYDGHTHRGTYRSVKLTCLQATRSQLGIKMY